MSNLIIGVHGLLNKPAPNVLEHGWKAAILEGLSKTQKYEPKDLNFILVYWASEMYDCYDDNSELYREAEPGSLKIYSESSIDRSTEDILSNAGEIWDKVRKAVGTKISEALLKGKLDDLYRYYKEEEKKKTLRNLVKDTLLNNKDKRIMLIGHSMGSIIAYDALRKLAQKGKGQHVKQLVTLGSPLGLPSVCHKIKDEFESKTTPEFIKKWFNFSDRRDKVSLDAKLADDYKPNEKGKGVIDNLVNNDWENHHKSYGYLRAPEVSSAIKRFLEGE